MDKVEVDPKLFITCRLCLSELGQYQIVPKVQQQIKFCFDIEVNGYDGLPQLICKGCETILSQFDEIKRTFQQKQQGLKSNVKDFNVVTSSNQKPDIVHSTQSTPIVSLERSKTPFQLSLKKKPITPEPVRRASSTSVNTNNTSIRSNEGKEWLKNYEIVFACKTCSKTYKTKKSVNAHLGRHKSFLKKYSRYLRDCSITLPRIDNKPNITGNFNMVMLSDKIVQNCQKYVIYYKPKIKNTLDYDDDNDDEENLFDNSSYVSSDDEFVNHKKRKRIRLLSKSSSDTVVLEDDNKNKEIANEDTSKSKFSETIECVDIDSSSESDTEKKKITPVSKNNNRNKVISDIVSSCYNKFVEKGEPRSNEVNSKDYIQHKILSIGRKIVNKKSFNCTGLLRYLENKHLEIKWKPYKGKNNEVENVRIRTKLNDDKKEENTSWKALSVLRPDCNKDSFEKLIKEILPKPQPPKPAPLPLVVLTSLSTPVAIKETIVPEQAAGDSETHLQKLLNPNPVANPKQFPNKLTLLENVASTAAQSSTRDVEHYEIVDATDNTDKNLDLPIITNTVSLANCEADSNTVDFNQTTDTNKPESTATFVPRIKVKPVSQLMAEKPSSSVKTSVKPTWNVPVVTNTSKQKVAAKKPNEPIILHTVEFPNTKTLSPFSYFQKLLLLHKMVLLDSKATLPPDFSCLVKFKSMFKQETRSVTISLALFSNAEQFYIQVTDGTSAIDINNMLASWQWEILLQFRNEVVTKILADASKISKKMFDAANYFITVLKSIELKKTY